MNLLAILLLLLTGHSTTIAQTYYTPSWQSQRNKVLAYNVGIGAAIGGIGALIHKKDNEPVLKTLFKGMGVGAAGGFINFQSKNATYLITKNENVGYAWISKIGHSIGTSVIENAASNRNFWESWHISFGPVRLQIDKENGYRPQARLLPAALVGTIVAATNGRFDIGYTFASGTPVFLSDTVKVISGGYTIAGLTYLNAITIGLPENHQEFYGTFAHEYVHTLQYESFLGVNRYYPVEKLFKGDKVNWIYWDTHVAVNGLMWLMFYRDQPCFYNNIIEREASHFAFREPLRLCD